MESRNNGTASAAAKVDPRTFIQQRLGVRFTMESQRYAEGVLAHVERRERELAAADRARAE